MLAWRTDTHVSTQLLFLLVARSCMTHQQAR